MHQYRIIPVLCGVAHAGLSQRCLRLAAQWHFCCFELLSHWHLKATGTCHVDLLLYAFLPQENGCCCYDCFGFVTKDVITTDGSTCMSICVDTIWTLYTAKE
jgi:hypothetical protein